jgi:mono/diheme cytochrome c family protein
MKKLLKWSGIVIGGLVGMALLAGVALYPSGMKKLTQSYPGIPVETVEISTDRDTVARGRHNTTVWACTKCHGLDLSGSLLANDPFLGTIPASNLTAGKGGIAGSYTDADWIRAIRHGVKPDGRIEIFMYDYYWTMSDQDLGDLVAFLKQIPPVDKEYPAMRFGSIFPIAPAVGLFTPAAERINHDAPRPAAPAPGATIEYGKYLSVICTECHGSNLPGKLESWSQEDFICAVRTGVQPGGRQLPAAMSPQTFSELNDMEVAALWLYFSAARP